MEYPRTEIAPLLESIVKDNPTYPFPTEIIEKELLSLFLLQDEYEYFMMACYKKLKKESSAIIANIFLTALELHLDTNNVDPHTLSKEEYQTKLDDFISQLEVMQITIVDKKSPDGALMTAMQ
jgi:hypothetical protein